jgi:phosphoglycerol transferase MdoB-like AlkP superfamily enzyme
VADRLRTAGGLLAIALGTGAALRIVLFAAFHDPSSGAGDLLLALAAGLAFDALAMGVFLTPVFLVLAGFRLRVLRRRWVLATLFALLGTLAAFAAAVEYFYFEEFDARFNHIALDYVMYPHEVTTNISESYDVPSVVLLSALVGIGAAFLVTRRLRGVEFGPWPWSARWRGTFAVGILSAICLSSLALLPASISSNRITSEVAQNGLVQLVRAFATSHLDYTRYYRTLPTAEARTRAARYLGFPEPAADAPGLVRDFRATWPAPERPYDVVVILEESLGSEFVGALGATERARTPSLDRWSEQGLLLTHLVANGNRTVRGLEGVLCSYPPLPPDSIVKKSAQSKVACLGHVFADRGYQTTFVYGGYGVFDHLKPFMTANGYAEFVEQPDFPSDAFRTAWGVADEFLFDALLDRQRRAREEGTPLFATLLSVSNHKPFLVPPGRIARPEEEGKRLGAVAYADACIGRYLDQARDEGFLDHTLVLIVGDHGARVYGSERIPVKSYRIPALFLGPDPVWRGKRFDRLCSQVDLAPTLLSLAGISTAAPWFGVDLSATSAGPGRAFVHHDRDVGILTDDALVVLGLNQSVEYYRRSGPDSDELVRVPPGKADARLREQEKDVIAVFQTAFELYEGGRFRMP